jgi:hypothetical protein
MRRILPLTIVLAAAGCTSTTVSKLDYRTYKIEDSGVPGGSTAPDRRAAAQLCPNGYRVLNQLVRYNTPDGVSEETGQDFTTWTIRCL